MRIYAIAQSDWAAPRDATREQLHAFPRSALVGWNDEISVSSPFNIMVVRLLPLLTSHFPFNIQRLFIWFLFAVCGVMFFIHELWVMKRSIFSSFIPHSRLFQVTYCKDGQVLEKPVKRQSCLQRTSNTCHITLKGILSSFQFVFFKKPQFNKF